MKKTIQSRVKALFDEYQNQKGQKSPFFNVHQDGDTADVFIYDVIGDWWGISASDIVNTLSDIEAKTINIRVHSPGGDVFEGGAIMTALANHPARINTYVDGLAASMASGIVMAGSTRYMSEGAWLMIHEPWTIALGNASEFRDIANFLDQHTQNLAKNYSKRTIASGKLSHDEILAAMTAETWYTADDALEAGLIDEIVETVPVEDAWSASACLSDCKNTPKRVKSLIHVADERKVETEKEFINFLRNELGMSLNMAKRVAKDGFKSELVNQAGPDDSELLNEAELLEIASSLDKFYLNLRLNK